VCQAVQQLRVAAGGGDDVRSEGFGVLGGEGADPTGSAVDQQRLTGLQTCDVHVRDDGGGHLQQSRGGHEIHPGRRGNQLPLGGDEILRVAAAREQRHHLVADPPPGHTGADRLDDTGGLQADDVGDALRGRVVAAALQQVGAVHARGDGAHQHLPRLGGGGGGFLDGQGLDVPGLLDDDSSHGTKSMRDLRTCREKTARDPVQPPGLRPTFGHPSNPVCWP